MVIDTAWSIDWLSATFKQEGVTDLDIRRVLAFGFKHKQWATIKPKFGYAIGFQHPLGHIVFSNVHRPEMGVHLAVGGRALRAMADAGFTALDLLHWTLREGAKISRIDLAIDVFGTDLDPIALAKGPRVKDAPGTARKWSSIVSADGGKTAYIGSRQSDKFMRIYDKAAEQGLKDTRWVRFELELKGQHAREAARTLASMPDNERGAFIQGLMKAHVNYDDAVYQGVIGQGDAVYLPTTRKTADTTYNWVMNTVARSVAALIISRQDKDIWGEFVACVHSNMIAKGVEFDGNTADEAAQA